MLKNKEISIERIQKKIINTNKNVLIWLPCLFGVTHSLNYEISSATVDKAITKFYIRVKDDPLKLPEINQFKAKVTKLLSYISMLKVGQYLVFVFRIDESIKPTIKLFLEGKYSSIPESHKTIIKHLGGYNDKVINYYSIDGSKITEQEYKTEMKKYKELKDLFKREEVDYQFVDAPNIIIKYNHFLLALKNDYESRLIVAEELDVPVDELGDDIYVYPEESYNIETELSK